MCVRADLQRAHTEQGERAQSGVSVQCECTQSSQYVQRLG